MVQYTNNEIINDMINNSFLLHQNLYTKYKIPDPLNYLKNQYMMNYLFNHILLTNQDYNEEYFYYIKHLKNTYPPGFGDYLFQYLHNNYSGNLLDVYYELKTFE
jgi:hypothetical protein